MKTRILLPITLLCIGAATASCYFAFRTLFPPHEKNCLRIALPNACGAPYDAALFDPHLYEVTLREQYDDTVPIGTVLAQTPPAGAIRKVVPDTRRCPVTLQVSRGVHTVSIPTLVGRDYRSALLCLESLGLVPQLDFVSGDDKNAAGTVLSTDPPAENKVHDGDTVVLTVSAGKATQSISLPDLRSLPVEEAEARLLLLGLKCEIADEQYDPAVLPGCVIDTVAPIGASIPFGCTVPLRVSLGAQPDPEDASESEDQSESESEDTTEYADNGSTSRDKEKIPFYRRLLPWL